MKTPKSKSAVRRGLFWIGAACGVGAALFYTAANIFLRRLATEQDFVLVSGVKALCTAAVFWPWFVYLLAKPSTRVLPRWTDGLLLVFAGAQAQVFGNIGQQISLGVIGIALVVPIYMGSMVASSAILGWVFLKEPIDRLLALALSVLISSVYLLCLGAEQAEQSISQSAASSVSHWRYSFGVFAACLAGLAYSLLGVTIRKVLQRNDIPVQTPIVFVSTIGALGLGTWAMARLDQADLYAIDTGSWLLMMAAGLSNALAFLFLSHALRILPVAYVNAINVSQVAMAAALGVLLFNEALTSWLTAGLLTMILGFFLLAFRSNYNQKIDSPA